MPAVNYFFSKVQRYTEYYDTRIKNKIFGQCVFRLTSARHEYSQISLIRLIISYNLLMYLLKSFALKTYKTVYYVSNMAVFWIESML